MTLSQFIQEGADRLRRAGLQCADPVLHMKQIACHAWKWEMTRIYAEWETELAPQSVASVEPLLARRLSGEPFQYITGHEAFWNSDFEVGPGVLIPRPETELLVEWLLEVESRPQVKIVELGAGSGNIGISTLLERPNWEWHAFELNPPAQRFAIKNRERLLPQKNKYHLHPEDFFSGVSKIGTFDWLVANPPYVPSEDLPGLSKEVQHEPRLALDGGKEGKQILAQLIELGERTFAPDTRLLFEMDHRHSNWINAHLAQHGFHAILLRQDMAGHPRAVMATRK